MVARAIAGSGGGWHEKVFFASWPQFRIIVKKKRDTVAHFEWGPNTEFVWPSLIVFSLCFSSSGALAHHVGSPGNMVIKGMELSK